MILDFCLLALLYCCVPVKDACESYATCYHEAVKVYRIEEKKVQIEETDRKADLVGPVLTEEYNTVASCR